MKNLIILTALLCSACSHNFVKQGVTTVQRSEDMNFCYNYASQKAMILTQYGADAYMFARARDEYKSDCMRELGYVDKPKLGQ